MTLRLPPALRPWAPLLALLPAEIAPQIGELARRLALLVGPLRQRVSPGHSDPAGWDGLSRRGQPAQLLISEWALADALPDEFDRRAAMGEQLYLQRDVRAPHHEPISRVWFDCGPLQLGAPRVAQLALLLVFARRAELAGAHLHWGCLPGGQTFDRIDRNSLTAWLQARSAQVPSRLPAELPAADDHWVIGQQPARFGTPHWLDIEEALGVLPPALTLRVQGQQCRELQLPLPDPAVMTRLLRDPLPTATANPATLTRGPKPSGSPVWLKFGGGGYKLLLGYANGAVVAYTIPGQPGAKPGRWQVFSRHEQAVIACEAVGKRIVALTCASDGTLHLHHAPGRHMRWPTHVEMPADFAVPNSGQLPMVVDVAQHRVYVIDRVRTLWCIDTRQSNMVATQVQPWVLDATLFNGRWVYVREVEIDGCNPSATSAVWMHHSATSQQIGVSKGNAAFWDILLRQKEYANEQPFFLWHPHGQSDADMLMVAKCSFSDTQWTRLADPPDSGFFALGPDDKPLGVVTEHMANRACGINSAAGSDTLKMLKYCPHDRTFRWADQSFSAPPDLLTSPNPVLFAQFSPHSDILAWLDDTYHLYAWSLRQRALLLDITLNTP